MRYHSIDIIRGVAALSVVISHLIKYLSVDLSNLFDRGCHVYLSIFEWFFSNQFQGSVHPGVIMFIVLSGFCIHLPIAGAYERIEESGYWWQYAVRRLVRIVPVYWLACLLGVITLLVWKSLSTDMSWPHWLYSDGSISLGAIVRKFLMLDPLLPVGPVGLGNPALRTVATEVALYALYPCVLFILLKKKWLGRVIVLLVLYVVSIGIAALPMGSAWAYESVPRFLVWWTVGAYAADFYKDNKEWSSSMYGWGLTAVLGVVMFLANHTLSFRGSYYITVPLLALFTASLLASLLSAEHCGKIQDNVVIRVLSGLGVRSYSLYAIHMPILGLYALRLSESSMPHSVVLADSLLIPFCLMFAATEFCYRYVEMPSHHAAKRLGYKVLVQAKSSSCSD